MKLIKKLTHKNEKGQVLVILALALVALFGFAGLAIDGTRVYEARRQNQSTADSAALTAAGVAQNVIKEAQPDIFFCGDSPTALTRMASDQGITSAQIAAKEDGIVLARYDITTNGVTSVCGTDKKRTYMDFTAKVTTTTTTTFARVIGITSLPSSATATVRIYPYQSAAYGNAIASLSDTCGGVVFGGSSITTIIKGGVFSNSCIDGNGGPQVDVQTGKIQYNTTYSPPTSGGGFLSPTPQQTTSKLADTGLVGDPKCPSSGYSAPPSVGTASAGNYTGIKVNANQTLTLAPGRYCLKGDLDVGANGTLNATGVTFVFVTGSTSFNGTANLNLSAPTCPVGDKYCVPTGFTEDTKFLKGVLMYMVEGNASTITLNGSSSNDYKGLIYAPDGYVKINGTSDSKTFNTQIIAWNVTIEGNASLSMDQISDDTFHYQSSVEVRK